jgi:hypothetical protein
MKNLLLLPVFALSLAAPALAGDCDPTGFCHLSPWLPAGTATGDQVGQSVALDATTALLGAPGADAVHVYTRVGSLWIQTQTLFDPHGSGHLFGHAVALDGDRCYVGAPYSDFADTNAGAVHVFERGPGGFVPSGVLLDGTPSTNARLGWALDAHNHWLAVGAPWDQVQGRVHVWDFESGAASYVREVGGPVALGQFGAAVALRRPEASTSGYLFAGSPADPTEGSGAGSVAYLRVHPAEVAFAQVLRPTELEAGDGFGSALDFDGEHLIVGAPGDDADGSNAGAAYLYTVTPQPGPMVATFLQELAACGGSSNRRFGTSVAVAGKRVAVAEVPITLGQALGGGGGGVPAEPAPEVGVGGEVHLFEPDASIVSQAWEYERTLAAANAQNGQAFGQGLALSGPLVLAGAPGSSLAGAESGAGYLLSTAAQGLPGGLCPSPHLATTLTYGVGKAGPAGIPGLSLSKPPVPGQSTLVRATNLSPGMKPLLLLGTALDFLPVDGGLLLVADPLLIPLPTVSVTKAVGVPWDLPAGSSLVGLPLFTQVVAVDWVGLELVMSPGLGIAVGY